MSKRNIEMIKQEEPSFLKKFKQECGYKEGPTLETKTQTLDVDEDDDKVTDLGEDEKPQIVVLRQGDMSADEVERYIEATGQSIDEEDSLPKAEEDAAQSCDRVLFKKPQKNTLEKESLNTHTTSKKVQDKSAKDDKKDLPSKTQTNVTNLNKISTSLLSFDEEEEED